jgi:DNA-directed RNA polymerase specialized sigma24 family protein
MFNPQRGSQVKSNTKLTPALQAVIHAQHAKGMSDRAIAALYGISHTAVAYTLDPAKAPWRRQSVRKGGVS